MIDLKFTYLLDRPVGPVSTVCSHVGGDGAGLGELPVTDVTTERFLPRVGPAVGSQVGRLAERFVALRTPAGNYYYLFIFL